MPSTKTTYGITIHKSLKREHLNIPHCSILVLIYIKHTTTNPKSRKWLEARSQSVRSFNLVFVSHTQPLWTDNSITWKWDKHTHTNPNLPVKGQIQTVHKQPEGQSVTGQARCATVSRPVAYHTMTAM